jgi:uncharacterized protein
MAKNKIIKILEDYTKLLKNNNYKLKKVFLFGSYAKGSNNDNSDIDVAIILEDIKDTQVELIKLMKLRRNVDERIEPHPIDFKNFNDKNPFIKEIIKTGIEIK